MSIEQYNEPASTDVANANTGAAKIREAAEVMAMCKSLANAVCNTGMMPKHLRGKPEETAAVMLYGATLDLDPMQSVRSIYEVHGQPGLYARSMVALVLARGHEVWTVESSDTSVTVAGRRKGTEHVEQSTWDYARAKKAGYTSNSKYDSDGQAMLYAKAASEVCRKIAPDVLAGVYAVEELRMERWDAEVTHVERTAPRGLAAIAPSTSGAESQPTTPTGDVDQGETGTEPDSAPELMLNTSSALAKRMFALMGESGITNRDDRLMYVTSVVGREVESSSAMTEADARRVIAALEAIQAGEQA